MYCEAVNNYVVPDEEIKWLYNLCFLDLVVCFPPQLVCTEKCPFRNLQVTGMGHLMCHIGMMTITPELFSL